MADQADRSEVTTRYGVTAEHTLPEQPLPDPPGPVILMWIFASMGAGDPMRFRDKVLWRGLLWLMGYRKEKPPKLVTVEPFAIGEAHPTEPGLAYAGSRKGEPVWVRKGTLSGAAALGRAAYKGAAAFPKRPYTWSERRRDVRWFFWGFIGLSIAAGALLSWDPTWIVIRWLTQLWR